VILFDCAFGFCLVLNFFSIKLKRSNTQKELLKQVIGAFEDMQRSLEEVKQQLQALKPTLKKRFKVETMDIFGSYARGEQTEKSDVDILVTYSEGADLLLVAGLRRYLRRKLHSKVDVVSKNYLNPIIKDHVLNEAIPV
jgi:predicted nucleotidyltransferase